VVSDDVQERLALLEQHVQRAIELIGALRAENSQLAADRRRLEARVTDLTAEAESLRPGSARSGGSRRSSVGC
jgi:hypothetical protein